MPSYEEMNVEDLKDEARNRGIVGYSNMKKDELVSTLEADDRGEIPEEGDESGDQSQQGEGMSEQGENQGMQGGGSNAGGSVATRRPEGKLPKFGAEGGVIEEGTGDFAPGSNRSGLTAPPGVKTVEVETKTGQKVQVEAGIDGENPVSAQNPPPKAVLGGGRSAENDAGTASPAQGPPEEQAGDNPSADKQ